TLSPEVATFKLGEALVKSGRIPEAIDILSQMIADNPANENAAALLRRAIQSGKVDDVAKAVNGLQQAVFADPDNPTLVNLLADAYARTGRIEEGVRSLEAASQKVAATDREAAAEFLISAGELYENAEKPREAVAFFEKAIAARGLDE